LKCGTGKGRGPPETTKEAIVMSATVTERVDLRGATSAAAEPTTRRATALGYTLAATRLSLGFVFFWAFIDKVFGLGFATPSERAWVNGGSPTTGFLSNVEGPFSGFFGAMAGQAWADWLFMAGLAGVGIALLAGVAMRVAAASGALLMMFMWMAALPLETNPFMDDHLVYAMVLIALALTNAGDVLGLGTVWARLDVVKRLPVLR
jgi:thiosulfate dehydrogenase [quinone] large subunit